MKELSQIVSLYNSLPPGESAALATLVRSAGPANLEPGPLMLVTGTGATMSANGARRLETDVIEGAQRVIRCGVPEVDCYDDFAEDPLFALGLGCGEMIEVYIEPVTAGETDGIIPFFAEGLNERQNGAIATVIRAIDVEDMSIGARLLSRGDNLLPGARIPPKSRKIRDWLTRAIDACMHDCRSFVSEFRLGTGLMEAFVEYVPAPINN